MGQLVGFTVTLGGFKVDCLKFFLKAKIISYAQRVEKISLCETDSPDTGEVALAPEGERCPEGAEGENLAIARNISGAVQFSPPPPAGGAPSQRGHGVERTFFDSLRHCSGLLMSTILHPRSTASQVAKSQGLLITCKNSSCSIFHQFLLL